MDVIGPPVKPVPVKTEVTPAPRAIVCHVPELFCPSNTSSVLLKRNCPANVPGRCAVVPVGNATAPVPGNTGFGVMLIVGLAEPSPPTTVIC